MDLIMVIRQLLDRVRRFFLGETTLVDATEPKVELEMLKGLSSLGYSIAFYCREKKTKTVHSRWYRPDFETSSYTVFTVLTGDAPELLRRVCEPERTFPPLLAPWESANNQKQAAIEAYLDQVLEDLMLAQPVA